MITYFSKVSNNFGKQIAQRTRENITAWKKEESEGDKSEGKVKLLTHLFVRGEMFRSALPWNTDVMPRHQESEQHKSKSI